MSDHRSDPAIDTIYSQGHHDGVIDERRRISTAIDDIVADIRDADEIRDRDLLIRIRMTVNPT